ncbi:MAG: tRNA pseudouridine(38-40) synthase TruA [Gammaproteobacteria bacterium]|nr:tRNA pseudouridine(38-40) synthase TruA [Gammaproteobacteria bacterium]
MQDNNPEEKHTYRIALGVEYDGSHFSGWQKQAAPELPTVQRALEKALSRIADRPVALTCAGRTDKGVHATAQVVHFDCDIDRGSRAWETGTNSLLPPSVRVIWSKVVAEDFHARFKATARRYLYLLYDAPVAPALLADQLTYVNRQLDIERMHEAARHLIGEHDFSAYRAAGCQSRTPDRCIHLINVQRKNRYIVVDIQANAFLQHMVRNIVGMLLEVGRGERGPNWAGELLQSRDRTAGGVTAPAAGLYLVQVTYPEEYGLPQVELGPSFLRPYP